MKIENAIKKLTKAGFTVTEASGSYSAKKAVAKSWLSFAAMDEATKQLALDIVTRMSIVTA